MIEKAWKIKVKSYDEEIYTKGEEIKRITEDSEFISII